MTRRVHLLSSTADMGFTVQQVRAGYPGSEVWAKRADVVDAVKWGFISAAPGEWRLSDIRRVTEAILAALDGEDGE